MMSSWGDQFEQGQAEINYYLPLLLFKKKRWWKLQDDNCYWLILEQEEEKGEMEGSSSVYSCKREIVKIAEWRGLCYKC